ncbi:hypothetical protein SNEBB_001262 [Seison nebaliae]|nr:hypothetical protein SNEBB_001262 [Seison nebaliae]
MRSGRSSTRTPGKVDSIVPLQSGESKQSEVKQNNSVDASRIDSHETIDVPSGTSAHSSSQNLGEIFSEVTEEVKGSSTLSLKEETSIRDIAGEETTPAPISYLEKGCQRIIVPRDPNYTLLSLFQLQDGTMSKPSNLILGKKSEDLIEESSKIIEDDENENSLYDSDSDESSSFSFTTANVIIQQTKKKQEIQYQTLKFRETPTFPILHIPCTLYGPLHPDYTREVARNQVVERFRADRLPGDETMTSSITQTDNGIMKRKDTQCAVIPKKTLSVQVDMLDEALIPIFPTRSVSNLSLNVEMNDQRKQKGLIAKYWEAAANDDELRQQLELEIVEQNELREKLESMRLEGRKIYSDVELFDDSFDEKSSEDKRESIYNHRTMTQTVIQRSSSSKEPTIKSIRTIPPNEMNYDLIPISEKNLRDLDQTKLLQLLKLIETALQCDKYQTAHSTYRGVTSLKTDFELFLKEIEHENKTDRPNALELMLQLNPDFGSDLTKDIVEMKQSQKTPNSGDGDELMDDKMSGDGDDSNPSLVANVETNKMGTGPHILKTTDGRYQMVMNFLWIYSCYLTRSKNISCSAWNPRLPDMIAIGYGSFEFSENFTGLICLWSLKNPDHPTRYTETDSKVACVEFSKESPGILATSLHSGFINLYNIAEETMPLIYTTSLLPGAHMDTVWQIRWFFQEDRPEVGEQIMSVGMDGRVCTIYIDEQLMIEDILQIDKLKKHIPKHLPRLRCENVSYEVNQPGYLIRRAGVMCFDINPFDGETYLIGTDQGKIHLCSISYPDIIDETFDGHSNHVYQVQWSPFDEDAFLSCSADSTIRIWRTEYLFPALILFSNKNMVYDVKWSIYSSTAFIATCNNQIQIWDLKENMLDPMFRITSPLRSRMTIATIAPQTFTLLIGTNSGQMLVYNISSTLSTSPPHLLKGLLTNLYANLMEQRHLGYQSRTEQSKEDRFNEDRAIERLQSLAEGTYGKINELKYDLPLSKTYRAMLTAGRQSLLQALHSFSGTKINVPKK